MRLDVGATRLELMRLRRRLLIARRGHKLLKDKQEELMRHILALIRDIRELRRRVEHELAFALRRFEFARALGEPREVDAALILPKKKVAVETTTRTILNVRVPVFEKKIEETIRCYGFYHTSGELDLALAALDRVLSSLIELAEKEKTLELLADEIERTRRRVNALEFVLIPNIEETVRFIVLKLSENERGDLVRLMRVKELIGR